MPTSMRWQDAVALLAGAFAALSPLWMDTSETATWTMAVLGACTVLVSAWSMYRPEDEVSEYAQAVLGVLLFISPWVMDFTRLDDLALTAYIAGAIVFVMGAWASFEAYRMHHPHAAAH